MEYRCPRCGGPVKKGYSGVARVAGGVMGNLFYAAFGSLQCAKCGKLARREFPQEARREMTMQTLLLVIPAVVLLIGLLVLVSRQ